MSKQFVKGNVYVFAKKKFMEEKLKRSSKSDAQMSLKKWVNSINGNEITMTDNWSGNVAGMLVNPSWCKCIKNNNPKIGSEEMKMKDKKINLCETCEFCFADCNNGEEGVDFNFGTGLGFDNVYECNNYKNESEEI